MSDIDEGKSRMARELYESAGFCSHHTGPHGWHYASNYSRLVCKCSVCGGVLVSLLSQAECEALLAELQARRAELGLEP